MDSPSQPPTAQELFHKWRQFLEGGLLQSATQLAAGRPDVVEPLQQLISSYISECAADLDETLTVGADDSQVIELPPEIPGLTVLGRLGRGGMGIVYRVRDALDREFALKLVRKGNLSSSGRERFLEEARAMARLDHPNVARVHHYGLHEDQPYFLMRVFPASLSDRLDDYKTDMRRAVGMMTAVADGVGHMHTLGLIHRDLKPQNILLDADGTPAVSDFGLVKDVADVGSGAKRSPRTGRGSGDTKPDSVRRQETQAGAIVGTRRYMAPEQAAGLTGLANPRWDVWAIGVILHELLTGHWPASSANPSSMLDPRTPDDLPPSTLRPDIDPAVEQILCRCLARDETQRYANAQEVATALRSWSGARSQPRRRRALYIAGAVIGVALGALIVIQAVRKPGAGVHDPGETPATPGTLAAAQIIVGPKSAVRFERSNGQERLIIDSHETALVDLFPAPGHDRYRFALEMQDRGSLRSQTGIFVGRHPVLSPDGEFQTFASLTFNDHWRVDKAGTPFGRWEIRSWSILTTAAGAHVHREHLLAANSYPTPKNDPDTGWHRLAVEADAKDFHWEFDGQRIATTPHVPAPSDQALFQRRLNLPPTYVLKYAPHAPAGIIAFSSVAIARNAKLAPPSP